MFLPVSCFFQCPELTIPVFLTVGECPLCTLFFSLSWLDPSCASHSWWVPLACISFIVLTWPLCALSLSVSWLGPSHVLDSWWVPLCGLFLSVSWLDLSHALNRLWVPCMVCFCWPSLYTWQEVSTPFFFSVLSWPSLCAQQLVSVPRTVCFFQCPGFTLPVCLTNCECLSRGLFLSLPASPFPCSWQTMISLHAVCFFQHPDLTVRLTVGECPLHAFFSVFWPSLCTRQLVSANGIVHDVHVAKPAL